MSEQEPYEPVVHVNGLGQKRYQPRKPSGQRLYVRNPGLAFFWITDENPPFLDPALARTRKGAIKIARKSDRRLLKSKWAVKGD